jgi:hypothetical protein
MANVEDLFITTTIDPGGLNAPMGLPPPPTTTSLIGVIELLDKNNLLACANFKIKYYLDFILYQFSKHY